MMNNVGQRRLNMMVHFNSGVCVNTEEGSGPMYMIHMTSSPKPHLHPVLRNVLPVLNPSDIAPQQGQIYHVKGPGHHGKAMRSVVEHWVANALAQGEAVHWIDGACRIDPGRFIPLLKQRRTSVEAALSRLYLSRGFTLHQLDHQLDRLPRELAITRTPLLVVDGLLTMHEDDAIRRRESRVLLKRHLALLQRTAHERHVAVVVITAGHHHDRLQQQRIDLVQRSANNHLTGIQQKQGRAKHLRLLHPKSGRAGMWGIPHSRQTAFRTLTRDRSSSEQVSYPVLTNAEEKSVKRR